MSRLNLFGKSQILVGDRTSHGGVVVSGSPTNTWHGVSVARMKDAVWCPRCSPHLFEIAEGLENCTDAGLPMATEGHRVTCGALLIAETSSFGLERARAFADAISNGSGFDEQVRLEHEKIEGLPYFIQLADGAVFSGRVGPERILPKIFTAGQDEYQIFWGDEALAKMGGVK